MLPRLSAEQIIVVHATIEHNPELLQLNPPIMQRELDDSKEADDVRNAADNNARFWDIYKEIVQLSFLWNGRYTHFMLCDDVEAHHGKVEDTNNVMLELCASEAELIEKAFLYLWTLYGGESSDGRPMLYKLLVGWHTHSIVWPALASRAVKYGVDVPQALLTDPEKKWPTIYGLADLASIYAQSGSTWRSPGLANILNYWGYNEDGDLKPMPASVRSVICEHPELIARWVEPYLHSMNTLTRRYYGIPPDAAAAPLAGLPVPQCPLIEFHQEKHEV